MAPIANLTVRLSAQIAEFQSEFREAARSVDKFQGEFQATATKAVALGSIIATGVTAAARGLQSLAVSVLENASNITDLSQKTGLAMSTIQEFQHVAEQTGTTVDAFTNAAFKLGANLAGGSKSVVAGVTALGLSFKDLQALSPDEQFNAIADALGKMENPQERNHIALTLFGKAAKDILPAISEGYRGMADAATKASDDQIQALDEAGDAWAKFQRDVVTHATGAAGAAILAAKGIQEAGIVKMLQDTIKYGSPTTAALDIISTKFVDVQKSSGQAASGNTDVVKSMTKLIDEQDRLEAAQKKAKQTQDAYNASVKTLADRLSGAALAGEVKKLSDAFKSLSEEQRRSPEIMDRTAVAAVELLEAGARLTPELTNIVIETGRLSDLLPTVKLGLDSAALGFTNIGDSLEASIKSFAEFNALMDSIKASPLTSFDGIGWKIPAPQPPEPLPPTFWQNFLDIPAESLAQSARRNVDNVIGSLANAITTGDWKQFQATFRDAFAQFAGSAIAAGVNLLVPGLGTLLQPLFSAFTDKFIGLFDRNKGRDLVENFAESMGGFGKLQDALNSLGEEGKRLSELGTKIGRNNTEQALSWINQVTAALERQKKQQEENAQAAVAAAQKIKDAQDAATSGLRARISELGAEYDRLFDSIKNEAPEEVMGIIEQQTRARMEAVRNEQVETQNALDKVLQSLEDSFAGIGEAAQQAAQTIQNAFNGITINPFQVGGGGGPHGPGLTIDSDSPGGFHVPSPSFSGGGGGTIVVQTVLDGRVIAETMAPHTAEYLQSQGL